MPTPDAVVDCEIMIVGGGLAGTATAYESLLAGRTVCMTEITDWVGGQISSQGTTALDEYPMQRRLLYYPQGYIELRERIEARYGTLNPGECWVSVSCFMPDMVDTPVEKPGNIERPGVRQAHSPAYPGQIPLRALIPQQIDNLLVAGKSIAARYIVTASYRVHSFEWAVGTGAAHTLDFVLRNGVVPYELVDNLPSRDPRLEQLQAEIVASGNPVSFPNTSIFNTDWDDWNSGW